MPNSSTATVANYAFCAQGGLRDIRRKIASPGERRGGVRGPACTRFPDPIPAAAPATGNAVPEKRAAKLAARVL
jgi:hypothetical protein